LGRYFDYRSSFLPTRGGIRNSVALSLLVDRPLWGRSSFGVGWHWEAGGRWTATPAEPAWPPGGTATRCLLSAGLPWLLRSFTTRSLLLRRRLGTGGSLGCSRLRGRRRSGGPGRRCGWTGRGSRPR